MKSELQRNWDSLGQLAASVPRGSYSNAAFSPLPHAGVSQCASWINIKPGGDFSPSGVSLFPSLPLSKANISTEQCFEALLRTCVPWGLFPPSLCKGISQGAWTIRDMRLVQHIWHLQFPLPSRKSIISDRHRSLRLIGQQINSRLPQWCSTGSFSPRGWEGHIKAPAKLRWVS